MLKKTFKKLLWPPNFWRAYRVSRSKKSVSRSVEDPQLKLYSKILRTEFLHYGYFDDPHKAASQICIDDIRQAQIRYAELIIEQIKDEYKTALDVGCGMGGLINMFLKKGIDTVGVTPDRVQVDYITEKYPGANIIWARFQKMPLERYPAYFDAIIHSESLQYMGLTRAIENVLSLLKPDGRWIVVDYFQKGKAHEKSGHNWDDFINALNKYNLKIVHYHDITENIKPTLNYIYMWGHEIGRPIFEFVMSKLERKHPGKHFFIKDMIDEIETRIDKYLEIVDPDLFTKNKKYVLLSIERQK